MELTGKIIIVQKPISGKSTKTGNPWIKQAYVLEIPGLFPRHFAFSVFAFFSPPDTERRFLFQFRRDVFKLDRPGRGRGCRRRRRRDGFVLQRRSGGRCGSHGVILCAVHGADLCAVHAAGLGTDLYAFHRDFLIIFVFSHVFTP